MARGRCGAPFSAMSKIRCLKSSSVAICTVATSRSTWRLVRSLTVRPGNWRPDASSLNSPHFEPKASPKRLISSKVGEFSVRMSSEGFRVLQRLSVVTVLAVMMAAAPLWAQQPPSQQPAANPTTICGEPSPAPRALPPDNSGPLVSLIAACFEAQGGASVIDAETYLYYIQLKQSRPSEGVWMPYDDTTENTIREDFRRLWNTNFLDNLWIEVSDYTFSNGVVGKMVTYNMEERQRVKIVDYVGSKKIETTKIDEKLKEVNSQIRLDTFIDPGLVQKVESIVREMMKEKGFQNAEVTHEIKEMPGGPKLVHLTFHIDEGPKVKIRRITFLGNKAIGSGTLKRQMKENKEQWFLSFISGRGTYQEAKFDEDAEKVVEYYRDRGYIKANVGA